MFMASFLVVIALLPKLFIATAYPCLPPPQGIDTKRISHHTERFRRTVASTGSRVGFSWRPWGCNTLFRDQKIETICHKVITRRRCIARIIWIQTMQSPYFQGARREFPAICVSRANARTQIVDFVEIASTYMGPIVFIHIPKTGGTTVYAMIRDVHKCSDLHKLHPGRESLEKYAALPEERKNQLKVIYGHSDMRVQKLLPPSARYVTLLREPAARVISHYYYVRGEASNPLHELALQSSLSDWVERCGMEEMDNGQVRRLAGAMDAPFGTCSAEMLETAKRNVKEVFAVVGLMERFDHSYALMSQVFGWPIRYYPPQNVTADKPELREVSPEAIRVIERRNQFDMELYAYCQELFKEQLSETALDGELAALQARKDRPLLRWADVVSHYTRKKLRHWVPMVGD
jgi:hypothetical protein